MSAFLRFYCNIERSTGARNAVGDRIPTWSLSPGSPHPNCRYYRKSNSHFTGRNDGAAGVASPSASYVLSVPNLEADIKVGDRFMTPEGYYGRIVAVRRYEGNLQCDVERGTVDLGDQPK